MLLNIGIGIIAVGITVGVFIGLVMAWKEAIDIWSGDGYERERWPLLMTAGMTVVVIGMILMIVGTVIETV